MASGGSIVRRLARRALMRCHPDGAVLFGDLTEEYERRRTRSSSLTNRLWFVRETVLACAWGQLDVWRDRRIAIRVRSGTVSIRQATRALRRRPVYALTVIVLVGVAAGAVGGLLGITRAIAAPAEVDTSNVQVVAGIDIERGWPFAFLSIPEIAEVGEAVAGVEDMGVFLPEAVLGLGRGSSIRPVSVVLADGGYFDILGARTILGRTFTREEGQGHAGAVAILSKGLWAEHFGSDRDVVGRVIEIAGRSYRVIGVMEEGFRDAGRTARPDVWLPLGELPAFYGATAETSRSFRWMLAVARIRPGRVLRARADADRLAEELRAAWPVLQRGRGFAFHGLREWWVGRVERPLRIMLAAAIGLLALVFGNIVVLFRVRSQERAPEMALRTALGARRGALRSVVLAEVSILAVAAAGLGVAIAVAFIEWGRAGVLFGLPPFVMPRADLLAVVLSAAGIVPLALLSGTNVRRARVSSRRPPARWLLAVEAAFAALLLTAAGALVQDARQVAATETGYEAPDLLTARLNFSSASTDPAVIAAAATRRIAFAREFVTESSAIPGVASGAIVGPSLLGSARWHMAVIPDGMDPWENATRWLAQQIVVTPGALATLGVELLQGRDIDWTDHRTGARAAVIDERIARRFWPDGNAVGEQFCGDGACRIPYLVVGVAETAKHRGRLAPDADVAGDVYVSYLEYPNATTSIVVRTDGTIGDVSRDISELVSRLEPSGVVSDMQWMEDRLHSDEFIQRMTASLVAICAAVAALLALVGTYGLVAYHIGRRWRDLAVRLALGAQPAAMARNVFLEAALPVMAGALLGAACGQLWTPQVTAAVSRVAGIGGWGWMESVTALCLLMAAGAGSAVLPLIRLRLMHPMAVLRAD